MVVVIPAYQPDEHLPELVDAIRAQTDFSVVVVNDGSDDDRKPYFDAVREKATVLEHSVNCGKGRAMKTAFSYIIDHFPAEDGVVIVDSDGQHLIRDMLRLCEELHRHQEALILGSREFSGDIPWKSKAGNTITRHVFAAAGGVMVRDTQTGLRAMTLSRLPALIALKGERYEYEMYMLSDCVRRGIPIREVSIATVYLDKDNSASHFHPLRDSWRIYRSILTYSPATLLVPFIDYAVFLLLSFVLSGFAGIPENLLARLISAGGQGVLRRDVLLHQNARPAYAAARFGVKALVLVLLSSGFLLLFSGVGHLPLWLGKLLAEGVVLLLNVLLQGFFAIPTPKADV